ncbi:hypothetical protein HU200_033656 [Digitaria exilis]|uniref:Leucine-rich repeat-containing N-terminal plant-type domain-containing protein n=1 Tax=Digitaria exilis TaxID=1010633 RepID=A0A835BRB9_9POAL|nr:hypothetical protein HU200_033656 [Digitaria exilis]
MRTCATAAGRQRPRPRSDWWTQPAHVARGERTRALDGAEPRKRSLLSLEKASPLRSLDLTRRASEEVLYCGSLPKSPVTDRIPSPHYHGPESDVCNDQEMATPRRGSARFLMIVLVACILHHRAATQHRPAVGEAELLLEMKRDPASAAGAHCRWPYVRCNSAGRVMGLTIVNTNVTGPIPNAVGNLSSLVHLDLSNNIITGTSLQYLDLSNNAIGGELPDDIGRGLGMNLSTLALYGNEFNGSIPASLSRLRNLRFLGTSERLGRQILQIDEVTTGASLSTRTLKKLQHFVVYMNNLTGDLVVDGFAAMSLNGIDIGENKLTGIIPEVFGRLENLTYFILSDNNFSGDIPPELGKHSPRLSFVELDNNELTGVIPEGLCAGGHLHVLSASNNGLNGSIPIDLANCATLRRLYLANNKLSGWIR